jgi:hypothetical protein
MYYEEDDQYHPNNLEDDSSYYEYNENHDENDDFSFAEVSIVSNANRKKQQKLWEDVKTIDKGYGKIARYYNGKKINIDMYGTSHTPGTTIRDAVTGARYPGLFVGSNNENQFFKVKIVSEKINNDPLHYFFFTPDECERHMKTTLNPLIKTQWEVRFQEYQRKYAKKQE